MEDFQIRARRSDISFLADKINLYAFQKQGQQRYAAQKLELMSIAQGAICGPFIEITMQESQQLMDDLWDCGLRPSEGSGSAGALRAVENHLRDMEKIAFHVLKIPKG